jgi:hypothetical protein
MDNIVEIWKYLENVFDYGCLAEEIFSFSVAMSCNFNDFENFASYPFKISFPGLKIGLKNNWKNSN